MLIIIKAKDTDNIIGLKEDISARLEGVADIERIDVESDMQFPKKPFIPWDSMSKNFVCPECQHILFQNQKHCDECGQKLDWKER